MPLPPGPPLPKIAQTFLSIVAPIAFLDDCRRRYGDCFTIDTMMFGEEVCVCHPDVVRAMFTSDQDDVRGGEANAPLEPVVGRRSILLLDGEEHTRHRKLLLPPFHGERMQAYAATMHAITEEVIADWPIGRRFSLHPSMQRITIEVILRTVFGLDDGATLVALRDALTRLLDRQTSPLVALGTMFPPFQRDLYGLSPWAWFKRDLAAADRLIFEQIARRRSTSTSSASDVLALLLEARDESGAALTDGELRDELMTLLVAGHETTASQLAWTFELLLANPAVHARVKDEVKGKSLAEIVRLPYLDAVIKEGLRLRPVIPAMGRKLHRAMEVSGFLLPAGTVVVPVTYLTHRDPALWPDPDRFDPDRFLDAKVSPYAWFPFGGGGRRCLGMAFAMYEMKLVAATILQRYDLRPTHRGVARVALRGFTYVPNGGACAIATRRGDDVASPRGASTAPHVSA